MMKTERIAAELEKLGQLSDEVLVRMKKRNSLVEIFLLPNKEMCRLERLYMGKRATYVDVLSFPETEGFPRPDRKRKVLGQVCLNAKLLTAPDRLKYLLVHGTLHLLGYSHSTKGDMIKMKKAEERLCHHVLSSAWISELRP